MWSHCLLLLIFLPFLVNSSPYSSCPSGDPRPDSVTIPNCSEEHERCQISKSQYNKVYFNFTAPGYIEKMFGRCHVYVGGIWVNIPTGKEGDVCANLISGECPLEAGTKASYSINQKIPSYAIVGMKTQVRLQAIDEKNKVIGCILVNVNVVK